METTPQSKTGALLESLDAGDIMREADEQLAELTQACESTGGKGKITITLDFERKKPGMVVIRPSVVAKIPRDEPMASVRYIGRNGDLVERDPAQGEFDFQNVTPMEPAKTATK